jgi:uncharacterized protein
MTYLGIGFIVGIIMGLTGAGGAMISIPLFLNLLGTTLKEATVLSLVAVVFGTSVNLMGQFSKIDKKIALSLSASGIIANYGTLFLKSSTPDIVVAGLLTTIAIYSLWTIWASKNSSNTDASHKGVMLKSIGAGSLLGILTTITGLGGGVILVPLLIKLFGKSYHEALPTSLATILLISLTSFIFQSETALQLISFSQLGYLGVGALLAFFLLKVIIKKINITMLDKIRKIVFSLVTVYSAISVIIKAM